MPPEVYNKQTYDCRLADVWCLGVCLFMVCLLSVFVCICFVFFMFVLHGNIKKKLTIFWKCAFFVCTLQRTYNTKHVRFGFLWKWCKQLKQQSMHFKKKTKKDAYVALFWVCGFQFFLHFFFVVSVWYYLSK